MEKTFSFRTETSASVEVDQHNKLLNNYSVFSKLIQTKAPRSRVDQSVLQRERCIV